MKLILITSLLFFISCKPAADENADPANLVDSEISLAGDYETACMVAEGASNDRNKTKLSITNSKITFTNYYYEATSSCVQNNNVGKTKMIYGYNYDGAKLTLTKQKKFYILLHNKVALINQLKSCGFNDWAFGVEKEVTNIASCFGDTFTTGDKEVVDNVQRQSQNLIFPKNIIYLRK